MIQNSDFWVTCSTRFLLITDGPGS